MMKLIQRRNWLFAFSIIITIPGIIGFALFGLKLGLDFTGGTKMTLAFSSARPETTAVVEKLADKNLGDITAQTSGDKNIVLRLPSISDEQRQDILTTITTSYPTAIEESFDSVGPVIGRELLRRALIAVSLVLIMIVVYISWAFRRVNIGPVPAWVYGLSAIVALLHDIILVVGIFALLGHYAGVEIDSLFVTALLTVLGFSIHDTIVVFDRIRERLVVGHEPSFTDTVNVSLNQTLVRSLNTSLTTMLVLAALYLFGGESIRSFTLALLIGIASGTYSSIFVASPLLVVYERWKAKRR